MIANNSQFPVFEANQVLTSQHLNDLANYLDEQTRITRVLTLGVGIVCGLGLRISDAGKTVNIGKGYGISSEGYFAVIGPQDFAADKYQVYQPPKTLLYPQQNAWMQQPGVVLYELLDENHEQYDQGSNLSSDLLQQCAVLLFIELREDDNKNCSPSSCDDKGKKVIVTLRKLLIQLTSLPILQSSISQALNQDHLLGDFFPNWTARFVLPELRLPRLPLSIQANSDTQALFRAYQQVLSSRLFQGIGSSLDQLYAAFQSLLPALASANSLSQQLNQIETKYREQLAKPSVIYSQYVYDLLDDLIAAYSELREVAAQLTALCNAPQALFPQFLMLGKAATSPVIGYDDLRHYLRPAPPIDRQAALHGQMRQLFERLKLMLDSFDIPVPPNNGNPNSLVKISPSRYGAVPLSQKAIPYYYQPSKIDNLLQAWNPELTRKGQADFNTGYRSNFPIPIEGGSSALEYNLEGYDFFRIEGHVGLPWRAVLDDLIAKIKRYRLSFDVVVVNAHPNAVGDASQVAACFSNDLQIIYDSWSKELQCLYEEKLSVLSKIKLPSLAPAEAAVAAVKPTAAAKVAAVSPPNSAVTINKSAVSNANRFGIGKIDTISAISRDTDSLGSLVGKTLDQQVAVVNTPKVDLSNDVLTALPSNSPIKNLTISEVDLAIKQPVNVISSVMDFSSSLPDNLVDMDFVTLSDKYQAFNGAVQDYFDNLSIYVPPVETPPIISQPQKDQILQVLQDLMSDCLIQRLQELGAELERRKKQIEQQMFFSQFLLRNPGMEHKAGVSNGGTFVLVFQQAPTETSNDSKPNFLTHQLNGSIKTLAAGASLVSNAIKAPVSASALSLSSSQQQLLLTALKSQGINVSDSILSAAINAAPALEIKPASTFTIPEQVVIADFFLPYRCSSNCAPVQFNVPKVPPTLLVQIGCTNPQKQANVTLTVKGGLAPFELIVDEKSPVAFTNQLLVLSSGSHSLQVVDAEGSLSAAQTIEIAEPLSAGAISYQCSPDGKHYRASFSLQGGTPPYRVNDVALAENSFTSPNIDSGNSASFTISDSRQCVGNMVTVSHTCPVPCDLPCDGVALKRGYRFALPGSKAADVQLGFSLQVAANQVEILTEEVNSLWQQVESNQEKFAEALNQLIAEKGKVADLFKFQIVADPNSLLDTWIIENYRCLGFELTSHWVTESDQGKTEFDFSLTAEGSNLQRIRFEQITSLKIPAFNISRIERCKPGQPEQALCESAINPDAASIGFDLGDGNLFLNVQFKEDLDITELLWEVPFAEPPFASQAQAQFDLNGVDVSKLPVRLSLYNSKGCRLVLEDTIDLNPG